MQVVVRHHYFVGVYLVRRWRIVFAPNQRPQSEGEL
jgi:hypothetical protein